jgi:hypothetical protein
MLLYANSYSNNYFANDPRIQNASRFASCRPSVTLFSINTYGVLPVSIPEYSTPEYSPPPSCCSSNTAECPKMERQPSRLRRSLSRSSSRLAVQLTQSIAPLRWIAKVRRRGRERRRLATLTEHVDDKGSARNLAVMDENSQRPGENSTLLDKERSANQNGLQGSVPDMYDMNELYPDNPHDYNDDVLIMGSSTKSKSRGRASLKIMFRSPGSDDSMSSYESGDEQIEMKRNFDADASGNSDPLSQLSSSAKSFNSERFSERSRRPSVTARRRVSVTRSSMTISQSKPSMGTSIAMSTGELVEIPHLDAMLRAERVKEWAYTFRRTDPRYQISHFFNEVALLGSNAIVADGAVNSHSISPLLRMFHRSSIFTVWRPTSNDAIRKMMKGTGTGKGLDIKGKSAKRGKLSGFVPFLQLHLEQHKKTVRTLPKNSAMRIFFATEALRDEAAETLAVVGQEMLIGWEESMRVLDEPSADEEKQEHAMEKFMWEIENPEIVVLDEYADAATPAFGLEIPERLFWEAFVMRRDIYREPGSEHDTGRPSEPAFQDMNFAALRYPPVEGRPRAVIYQYSSEDPMCPLNLLVAYEENNRVLPVVSDFDCFMVGSRGTRYTQPLPDDQVRLVNWCLSSIEKILDAPPSPESWTSRWLEHLKENPVKIQMPQYGFGDPESYTIMKLAVGRLNKDGSVRHGAECFNYYFPQELDEHFLVIGESLNPKGPPWCYVNVLGLQEILRSKVKQGFTFPLNPKWLLCDPGWKEIYDELKASDKSNVQDSLNCWYPPGSGIREKIEEIHKKNPEGFVRCVKTDNKNEVRSSLSALEESGEDDGTAAMDLAQLELRNHELMQRTKKKLKAVITWMGLFSETKDCNDSFAEEDELTLRRSRRSTLLTNIRNSQKMDLDGRPIRHFRFRASVEGTASHLLERLRQHSPTPMKSVINGIQSGAKGVVAGLEAIGSGSTNLATNIVSTTGSGAVAVAIGTSEIVSKIGSSSLAAMQSGAKGVVTGLEVVGTGSGQMACSMVSAGGTGARAVAASTSHVASTITSSVKGVLLLNGSSDKGVL